MMTPEMFAEYREYVKIERALYFERMDQFILKLRRPNQSEHGLTFEFLDEWRNRRGL